MDVVKLVRPTNGEPVSLVRPAQSVRLILNRGPIIFNQGVSTDELTLVSPGSFSSGRLLAYVGGQLVYYSALDPTHLYALVGMSLNAANQGEVLHLKTSGEVISVGWNLLVDHLYFAGANGQISLAPSSGFNQIVGRAKAADTFMLSPQTIYING